MRENLAFLNTVFQYFDINFKEYNQQQNWLFPPSIEELIFTNHPVHIVNGVTETMDLPSLYEVY